MNSIAIATVLFTHQADDKSVYAILSNEMKLFSRIRMDFENYNRTNAMSCQKSPIAEIFKIYNFWSENF